MAEVPITWVEYQQNLEAALDTYVRPLPYTEAIKLLWGGDEVTPYANDGLLEMGAYDLLLRRMDRLQRRLWGEGQTDRVMLDACILPAYNSSGLDATSSCLGITAIRFTIKHEDFDPNGVRFVVGYRSEGSPHRVVPIKAPEAIAMTANKYVAWRSSLA